MSQLDKLLADNLDEIKALADCLKDVLTANYDNIWLLRYILSNKTAAEAEEPARFTINWNLEHRQDIENIRNGGKPPHFDLISQFQVTGEHGHTRNGEPIYYVRIGLCNTKALMDNVPYEQVLTAFTMARFKAVEYCDAQTRKEGRLVKAINVLDFQGASLSRGNDSRFSKLLGESSKLNEKLFPQLQGSTIMVNVPPFFMFGFNLLKPLMSKRALEKVVFCPGKNSGKPISACPYLSNYLNIDNVPTFLGGNCNCPGGCIGNVPNSQTLPLSGITTEGLSKQVISARKNERIEFPIIRGTKVSYTIQVESKKLEVSAMFSNGNSVLQDNIIEKRFVESSDVIEGKWNAKEDGVLTFEFDNSHSYFNSKTVMYKIDFEFAESYESPRVALI